MVTGVGNATLYQENLVKGYLTIPKKPGVRPISIPHPLGWGGRTQFDFNSQRSFQSSFIIVISGPEIEVFRAESYIISILKSELIEVQIPTGRQLEMFLSALPFDVSDSKAWVGG